jgi:hypothetical protein
MSTTTDDAAAFAVSAERVVGKLKIRPGQLTYELNVKTGNVTLAQIDWIETQNAVDKSVVHIKANPFCLYCTAMNEPNAHRRFKRMLKKLVK